ncbi:hypothetical protein FC48_GL001793 [Ligilactobacillus murinus DSM 20452 = NBRC 14221]|uniref:Uncharacterized protein n=1 Tax=Ligilactobacillus murinus DSM 20452 = NBRC 14221 TaxID=1423772 RepID=A0A0R2B1B7_9LACO|nr:hypothetical protein [Ligilactobacillus murinus]KRM70267.1 hypothetical protein FC48_GL001793 [Ligilactobacillus murinus DSM 20452 = NBRC 14221]NBH41971.1 hypothetical protein [Ligilactobacillus murinus]RII76567.1 hypothetical protein D1870_10360 [Ligilactobacillus murinus]
MKHKHSKFVKKSKKNTKQLSDEQVAKKLLAYVSEMEKYGVTLNALVGTYNSTNAPFVVTNNEDPLKAMESIVLILLRIKQTSGLEEEVFFDSLKKSMELMEDINQSEDIKEFMLTEEEENKYGQK